MNVTHAWTERTALIAVRGLRRPVRVLHSTDVHLSYIDERDADRIEEVRSCWGEAQDESVRHPFEELMGGASRMGLDLIVLTGDMISYPSQANVERLHKAVLQAGVPILYTSGNHDWQFPGVPGGAESRESWWAAPRHTTIMSNTQHSRPLQEVK